MASFEVTFYGQFWVTPEEIVGNQIRTGAYDTNRIYPNPTCCGARPYHVLLCVCSPADVTKIDRRLCEVRNLVPGNV
jgi:hypothetical protein